MAKIVNRDVIVGVGELAQELGVHRQSIWAVMNGTSPSESDVNNAISKLQKAESDVTASMQAKQQADAAKQAQEEAQQKADQEAQQKSQDESNNSDNNNGGDNSTSTDGTDGSHN